MKRPNIVITICLLWLSTAPALAQPAPCPNVVFILLTIFARGALSVMNHPLAKTPNVDLDQPHKSRSDDGSFQIVH